MDTDQIKGIFALVVILVCVIILVSKAIMKALKLIKSNGDEEESSKPAKNNKKSKEVKNVKKEKKAKKEHSGSSKFKALEKPGKLNIPKNEVNEDLVDEDDEDDDDRETIYKRNATIKLIQEGTRKSYSAVCNQEIVIGRKDDCDIQIDDDDKVSKYHCKIQNKGRDRFTIKDIGSTNGTILNDNEIKSEEYIETGDIIEIGDYTYKVNIVIK